MGKESDTSREEERFMAEVTEAAMAFFSATYQSHSPAGELKAGTPFRVRYLDRPGEYYLVPVFQGSKFTGIIQVDEPSLDIESSVRVRDPDSMFILPEEEAARIARNHFPRIKAFGTPFLGWKPCRESFNSLNPLWVFPHTSGEVYVTQTGEAAEVLSPGLGG